MFSIYFYYFFSMTFNVVQTNPYTIISKYHDHSTPIWVYIVSVLGGILLLVIITLAMYKVKSTQLFKFLINSIN